MEFLKLLEGVRTPFFDVVFQYITLFGEETLFMVFAMVFYWCVDKQNGYFLLYVSFLGGIVNQFLKLLFCVPRPWVLDEEFTIVESAREAATGYSFPSGHTQSAAGLFLGVGRFWRNTPVRILCVAITLLVGLSRMYLGVHTPADVLVSLGVALLLVMLSYPLFLRAKKNAKWYIPLVAFLLAVGTALIVYVECWPMPPNAIEEFSLAGKKTAYTMFGASLGFALVLPIEQRCIRFDTRAVWWAQILKVLLGLGIVLAIRILTKEPLLDLFGGHDAANGIRYFLMVAFGGAVWPLTFRFFGRLGKTSDGA